MNVLKVLKNYAINNPEETLVCLMAAMIPFMLNVGNISIILASAYALYLIFIKKIKLKQYHNFAFYFPLVYFLIIVISALTSKNVDYGIKVINKNQLFILIAFALFTFRHTQYSIKRVLIFFALSTTCATLILIVNGCINLAAGKDSQTLFFHDFTSLYDQHPVYFALYIALSIFILIQYPIKLKKESILKNRLLTFSLLFILFCGLILTASKAVIFIFFIIVSFQILQLIKKNNQKIIVLGFIGILIMLAANIPTIKNRFVEGIHFDFEGFKPTDNIAEAYVFNLDSKEQISDLELRYIFLNIGLFHVTNDHKLLFGYGVGDVQNYLDYYYMYYGLAPNWYEGYNVHNQYLQLLVSVGGVVLLFFISYLIFSFYAAIKSGNKLYLLFLIMVTFAFFFESYFERNKGIVFFIFMNTLFLIDFFKYENRNIRY